MLTVDYRHIDNWEDKFLIEDQVSAGRKVESPWVFIMGIFSMHVGINNITDDNAADFFMRARLIEACSGTMMVGPDGPVEISPEVVHRFIGVRFNTSPYTEAQFFAHLRKDVVRSLRDTYKIGIKELASV